MQGGKEKNMIKSNITEHSIFRGAADAERALARLGMRCAEYAKGERILHMGERCGEFGILLSGSVQIVREDAGGNPVTVAHVDEGELFAEAFALSGEPLSVSVTAAKDSSVAWFSAERLLAGEEPIVCANVLRISSRKNVFLNERIGHLSRRSIEEKVRSYLSAVRKSSGKNTFRVPFDRQGLADYLGCDRSALSAVLSKLKQRGVLDYHKNIFRIL